MTSHLTAQDLKPKLDRARRALAKSRRTVGAEHPLSTASASRLAVILRRLEEYEEAEQLTRSVLAIREAELGAEHLHTLQSRIELALILVRSGRPDEGRKIGAATLEVCQRTLEPTRPETRECRAVIDEAHAAAGQAFINGIV
ncbi:tetratricopeptide repeat protein [Streptomyces sp. NBC_01601]|uniref:tetratricopeptide repeat protein n=1 Tax=Streptomyces sp. NBC_01601 TaxID=2975892 RepID=UPI002E2B2B56|nr:tetratricopeptide repeat protein [Streptomyces sp. NBC_01601]